MNARLTQTLNAQRATLQIEPIHKLVDPVRAYADHISANKGEPFDVVTIPKGSSAYQMGYRFVSIPRSELAYFIANGSTDTKASA